MQARAGDQDCLPPSAPQSRCFFPRHTRIHAGPRGILRRAAMSQSHFRASRVEAASPPAARVRIRSTTRPNASKLVGSAQCASSKTISTGFCCDSVSNCVVSASSVFCRRCCGVSSRAGYRPSFGSESMSAMSAASWIEVEVCASRASSLTVVHGPLPALEQILTVEGSVLARIMEDLRGLNPNQPRRRHK